MVPSAFEEEEEEEQSPKDLRRELLRKLSACAQEGWNSKTGEIKTPRPKQRARSPTKKRAKSETDSAVIQSQPASGPDTGLEIRKHALTPFAHPVIRDDEEVADRRRVPLQSLRPPKALNRRFHKRQDDETETATAAISAVERRSLWPCEKPASSRTASRDGNRVPQYPRSQRRDRQQPTITDLLDEGQGDLVQIARKRLPRRVPHNSHIALLVRFCIWPTVEHVGYLGRSNPTANAPTAEVSRC